MRIIYDDIIYSLQKSGGISLYWNELEQRLPISKRYLYNNYKTNIFYKDYDFEYKKYSKKIFFERYKNLRLKNEKSKYFIFHSSYYRYCKNKNAVNVTTVHDFTYEKYRTDLFSKIHKWQKKNAVMHSDGVICISENTLKDFKKYYPRYNGQVSVIYHGFSDEYFLQNEDNLLRKNQVLFVGARGGYKNFDLTVNILSKINNLNLLIVGGGSLTEQERDLLNKKIPNRYEHLGFLSNQELSKLYNYSKALFYTSDYEGFGIPILEAHACGCPVVCQKVSSIPEVAGDAAIYIDRNNSENAVIQVTRLLNDNYFNEISKKSLENASKFSWKKTTEQTLNFYNLLFNSK